MVLNVTVNLHRRDARVYVTRLGSGQRPGPLQGLDLIGLGVGWGFTQRDGPPSTSAPVLCGGKPGAG